MTNPNETNSSWTGIVGLLQVVQSSSPRLGVIYSQEKFPSETDYLDALRFARLQLVWTLACFAFNLQRAEDGELPNTARMKYTDEQGEVRFLDELIHPISGWITMANGFCAIFPQQNYRNPLRREGHIKNLLCRKLPKGPLGLIGKQSVISMQASMI
ncbi:hypothetical protein CCYS_12785 [Corynebacterium cystitidis DSM 20524]|uniref:Uncharacterized protein n=1 Tax=Corynebacterium cystitidis DSM 20524 TaxID=1121357 RepID=A0A1H9T362_9CORY|nr:hypothetical protein CCYS_12785 [Corynebacterium cystitidis DSM 20524]SER91690.1 hypothetical protein SAMN05661109_01299 [Corynebacterium cystitidis DSM 20524]SNV61495.1 Uncharacterised protein [Corynebacterium cystitidis]